ncbi:MAG: QueT transporter family protein [Inconstantimicrobium porci]|uniref:QueT transporter family protein n=1 Tax=Inconstantimicrobium porci TaxID=2652291 RepID=A0A7X2MWS2_9CLOT|nr:QueT transporter family protein [Inconstantimicrobium porci]MDD6770095.1 QueT transporter family protein [Inconstantimicrobium porci]MDY5910537.1 QueT transporter family protein [Inconstantimicrobium porci]MSR90517.1 QueT transporter family protein [Inconstantimicrobium porci]
MNNITTKRLVRTALIAAIYVVLTLLFAPISYGGVQFRVSEVLVLLAFFDPFYIGGLTLGCFIANMLGPNGPADIIIGTFATFLSVGAISLTAKFMKNKVSLFVSSLWPAVFNGILIGLELSLFITPDVPFWINGLQVAAGELVVISIVGVPVFTVLKNKYPSLLRENKTKLSEN